MEVMIKREIADHAFDYTIKPIYPVDKVAVHFTVNNQKNKGTGRVQKQDYSLTIEEQIHIEPNNVKEDMYKTVASFQIGSEEGTIRFYAEKNNIYNGIYFWETDFKKETYALYEVGLGRKGIYLCIWNGDNLLGIIEKIRGNGNNEYRGYSLNEDMTNLFSILTIYWDLTRYIPEKKEKAIEVLNTCQDFLTKKYRSTFIDYVKQVNIYGTPEDDFKIFIDGIDEEYISE